MGDVQTDVDIAPAEPTGVPRHVQWRPSVQWVVSIVLAAMIGLVPIGPMALSLARGWDASEDVDAWPVEEPLFKHDYMPTPMPEEVGEIAPPPEPGEEPEPEE